MEWSCCVVVLHNGYRKAMWVRYFAWSYFARWRAEMYFLLDHPRDIHLYLAQSTMWRLSSSLSAVWCNTGAFSEVILVVVSLGSASHTRPTLVLLGGEREIYMVGRSIIRMRHCQHRITRMRMTGEKELLMQYGQITLIQHDAARRQQPTAESNFAYRSTPSQNFVCQYY